MHRAAPKRAFVWPVEVRAQRSRARKRIENDTTFNIPPFAAQRNARTLLCRETQNGGVMAGAPGQMLTAICFFHSSALPRR